METKPPSQIDTWGQWPPDVVDILFSWNHQSDGRLSFRRQGTFLCAGCQELCSPHIYGDAKLNNLPYCDDCLIAYVREGKD